MTGLKNLYLWSGVLTLVAALAAAAEAETLPLAEPLAASTPGAAALLPLLPPGESSPGIAQAQSSDSPQVEQQTGLLRSPLQRVEGRTYGLLTAGQLRSGELVEVFGGRVYSPVSGPLGLAVDDVNLNLSYGITYGISDGFELGIDLQGQNTTEPGPQQLFVVRRSELDGRGPNLIQEATVALKARVFEQGDFKASAVFTGTFDIGQRVYSFFPQTGGVPFSRDFGGSVPTLEVPFTFANEDAGVAVTISPRVAFFANDNAVWYPINPAIGGSFGTTFGIAFGGTLRLGERLQLRADFMPILAGNNTIITNTGLPGRRVTFNAGLRFLVNPRLGLDLFATNTIGNSGAAAFAARENVGFGATLTYVPDRYLFIPVGANEKFAKGFGNETDARVRRNFAIGNPLFFLDGGTLPEGTFGLKLRGGSRGFATALNYGLLDDYQIGLFANFTDSTIDESEAGASLKVRFLNQAAGAPFTLSAAATFGRTSARLFNFLRSDPNAILTAPNQFDAGVGDRGPIPPNLFQTERAGEQLIGTLSLPFDYTNQAFRAWFNPKAVYIQRAPDGLSPLIGTSIGTAISLGGPVEVFGEVSPILRGENALVGNDRRRVLPWSAGVRWQAVSGPQPLQLELYATNTLGYSPFQSLRVLANDALSVGLGLDWAVPLF